MYQRLEITYSSTSQLAKTVHRQNTRSQRNSARHKPTRSSSHIGNHGLIKFVLKHPRSILRTLMRYLSKQTDVDEMVCLGLNAVRIPVGWWLVEELKTSKDYFPTGQLTQLKRGLKMLKKAGIWVLLDIHANPGVQSANQQFTGKC